MATNRFKETIENRPLTDEEFKTLVVDRMPLLNEADDGIEFYYEPVRDDHVNESSVLVIPKNIGFLLKTVINSGVEREEKIFMKEVTTKEEVVPLLRKILVEQQLPNTDEWNDSSYWMHASMQSFKIIREYPLIENPTENDDFSYVEALQYIIIAIRDIDGNPADEAVKAMRKLAAFYGDHREFELEKKYLEMAYDEGDYDAACELGYMWYYGQHGEVNYAKAYHYFKEGMKADSENAHYSKYKIADMYRFGLHVEKDVQKYQDMVYELFDEIGEPGTIGTPFPEVAYRVAGIETEKGNTEKAVELLIRAKRFLAERLYYDNYWGSINIMERIVKKMYSLTDFDRNCFDFYDIFHLAGNSDTVEFFYDSEVHRIEFMEDGSISLDGKWYVDIKEFIEKASLGGRRITAIYDELGRMVIV